MYVVNGVTTPCLARKCTARSLDSGLTQPGRIRIDNEERPAFVGGLVVRFEVCVRIAADSPQQWPQSDLPLVETRAFLFVDTRSLSSTSRSRTHTCHNAAHPTIRHSVFS